MLRKMLSVHAFVAGLSSSFYGLSAQGFGVTYNSEREVFWEVLMEVLQGKFL